MILNEEWRPVVGYEGVYDASSTGRIRSVDRIDSRGWRRQSRVLRAAVQPSGHLIVSLCRDGFCQSFKVHVLVAAAFIGSRPPGMDVAHFDGNGGNNAVSNLRYATRSENLLDSVRHGTHWQTRKTQCPRGHQLDGLRHRHGTRHRYCKTCENQASRETRRRLREVAP